MRDLEDRLRDELGRKAQEFDPSPDLSERVAARIGRRSRQHRFLAVAATILVVGAVLGGALSLLPDSDSGGRVDMSDPARQTTPTTERESEPEPTTTTAPEPTTTTLPQRTSPEVSLTPSTTSTTTTVPPTTVDESTPLSRSGVGPIRVGMTIREVEEVTGITLALDSEGAWEAFGRSCGRFRVNGAVGTQPFFEAWTPNRTPSDDPRDAVIHTIGGGNMTTEEGITGGSTIDDVRAAYGEPTAIVDNPSIEDPMSRIHLYEQDGYSYGFLIHQGYVVELRAGHVTGPDFEAC